MLELCNIQYLPICNRALYETNSIKAKRLYYVEITIRLVLWSTGKGN